MIFILTKMLYTTTKYIIFDFFLTNFENGPELSNLFIHIVLSLGGLSTILSLQNSKKKKFSQNGHITYAAAAAAAEALCC